MRPQFYLGELVKGRHSHCRGGMQMRDVMSAVFIVAASQARSRLWSVLLLPAPLARMCKPSAALPLLSAPC